MKKPSQQEINLEITRLEKLLPRVRATSAFGDDNKAAVRADIAVLKEKLSEDDIYDRFEYDTGDEDENRGELDSALNARRWLDGQNKNPPSKDWALLAK